MTQNPGNKPSDHQDNSGHAPRDNSENTRYEGFEGMNYEQVRQPFHTQHMGNKDRENITNGNEGGRPDEY